MTRIKMSGLSREEDIVAANELYPDYIGFVFWPDSPHYITPEKALDLKENLDEDITVVGEFVDMPIRFVAALLNEDLIDIAQLGGSEDDAYIEQLRAAIRVPDEKAIVKTFIVESPANLEAARTSKADMVRFDAGEGRSLDWGLAQGFDRPYFLAGGLDPQNVEGALELTGAAYVDVGRGIETDGKKDPAKMHAFIQAVHAWDRAHPRLSFLESLHPEFHEDEPGEGGA